MTAVMGGALLVLLSSCGREPSSLLRQGQLPVYDFPLYVTSGVAGKVLKFERDRTVTTFASGLSNPLGIATDRWNNLYVVEQGAGKLWKFNTLTGVGEVLASGLQSPSVVAVDSIGEAFVAEDTPHDVIRASDKSVLASFYSLPAALVAGVGDLMIVGDYSQGKVYWGTESNSPSASVSQPVNAAIDGMGRVYVAEGLSANARVLRFDQTQPGGAGEVVADALQGPQGIAVDPVGNVYIVEKVQARITLVSHDRKVYNWVTGLTDPQYIAFTQY
jgi:sugar lactone lactonase YvrE